MSDDY